jgi:hypothetical protein
MASRTERFERKPTDSSQSKNGSTDESEEIVRFSAEEEAVGGQFLASWLRSRTIFLTAMPGAPQRIERAENNGE